MWRLPQALICLASDQTRPMWAVQDLKHRPATWPQVSSFKVPFWVISSLDPRDRVVCTFVHLLDDSVATGSSFWLANQFLHAGNSLEALAHFLASFQRLQQFFNRLVATLEMNYLHTLFKHCFLRGIVQSFLNHRTSKVCNLLKVIGCIRYDRYNVFPPVMVQQPSLDVSNVQVYWRLRRKSCDNVTIKGIF